VVEDRIEKEKERRRKEQEQLELDSAIRVGNLVVGVGKQDGHEKSRLFNLVF